MIKISRMSWCKAFPSYFAEAVYVTFLWRSKWAFKDCWKAAFFVLKCIFWKEKKIHTHTVLTRHPPYHCIECGEDF